MKTRYINFILFIPAFILVTSITGCEKIKELAEFDIYYNVPAAEISVDSTILEFTDNETLMLQQSMNISFDSIRRKHEFDKVQSAKFDFIRLDLTSPPGANFNWLRYLKATISAEGLDETEVGVYNGNDGNKPTVDLVLTNTSILPFVMKERIILRMYTRASPPLPASQLDLKLNSRIKITIHPI